MGFVDRTSHTSTITAPRHAGFKRPRAETTAMTLALYKDPSAADQQPEDAGALVPFVPSRSSPINAVPLSAVAPLPKKLTPDLVRVDAAAMVPFVPSRSQTPINAVPLSAVAPSKRLAPNGVRAEPPWLRRDLLPHLGFHRDDLPVRFIDEKAVTATDLVPHQNRFRLPSEGVMRNLWPLLSPVERKAANLVHEDEAPRPPRLPKMPRAPGEKATKRKGKKHGGLPVLVVEPSAGVRELQLARWYSSGGTVIKGEGYLDFIHSCGFKVDDVVEIWAFKESYLRLFGVDHCHESPLHLLIAKKGQMMLPR